MHAVGYALGCDVLCLGYALAGGGCVRRFARCVLRGRAAMDAGNRIGREGAASLAPALERMTQLISLGLQDFDSEDEHEYDSEDQYEEQEFD